MEPQNHYDVAVIGAGPAGVTAAAAAAKGGRRIALIEAAPSLGGSVSAAMHRCLCGLYSQAPKDPLDTLNDGGQREIIAGMMRLDPSNIQARQMGKAWVLEFPISAWEKSLEEHIRKPNIDRLTGWRVQTVERKGEKITALSITTEPGRVAQVRGGTPRLCPENIPTQIHPAIVIDCTGGGNILGMIGNDVCLPEEPLGQMLGGFSVKLTGLTGDLESLRLRIPFMLAKAVAKGDLPPEAKFTLFHPGPGSGEGICKFAVNPDQFSSGGMDLFPRKIIEHLRTQIDAFAKADVAQTSPHALARDGKRLKGKKLVTEVDILQGHQISADAVHAWWPIERWDVSAGPSYNYPPVGQHYDIPVGALQSASVENLLAAGTCVSATSAAAASLRASGICLGTGHAAGTLAASMLI